MSRTQTEGQGTTVKPFWGSGFPRCSAGRTLASSPACPDRACAWVREEGTSVRTPVLLSVPVPMSPVTGTCPGLGVSRSRWDAASSPGFPFFQQHPGMPLSGQWVLAPVSPLFPSSSLSSGTGAPSGMREEPRPALCQRPSSCIGDPATRPVLVPFLPPLVLRPLPPPPPPQSARVCELTGNGGTRAFLSALMKPFNHIQIGYCSGGK